jgi:hypothetical protein
LKQAILNIEESYTDTSMAFTRDWGKKSYRDTMMAKLISAETTQDVAGILLQLDEAFSFPYFVRVKEGKEYEVDQISPEKNDDGEDAEVGISRTKLKQFKFWPSSDYRDAWRKYIIRDGLHDDATLSFLYIVVKIFEKICDYFVHRQLEIHQKKLDKEKKI